jgi:hypothetical protein
MVVNARHPHKLLDVKFRSHALHSFTYYFTEAGLLLLFVVTKLVEVFLSYRDREMNQISFLRKPFVRIQNPVGFAIREVFAVFAKKWASSWTFTRQVLLFTFRNVSRGATSTRAYACRKDVKEDAHVSGLSSSLRQRILPDHSKNGELRISWSS